MISYATSEQVNNTHESRKKKITVTRLSNLPTNNKGKYFLFQVRAAISSLHGFPSDATVIKYALSSSVREIPGEDISNPPVSSII